jgi:hypothetical protein
VPSPPRLVDVFAFIVKPLSSVQHAWDGIIVVRCCRHEINGCWTHQECSLHVNVLHRRGRAHTVPQQSSLRSLFLRLRPSDKRHSSHAALTTGNRNG